MASSAPVADIFRPWLRSAPPLNTNGRFGTPVVAINQCESRSCQLQSPDQSQDTSAKLKVRIVPPPAVPNEVQQPGQYQTERVKVGRSYLPLSTSAASRMHLLSKYFTVCATSQQSSVLKEGGNSSLRVSAAFLSPQAVIPISMTLSNHPIPSAAETSPVITKQDSNQVPLNPNIAPHVSSSAGHISALESLHGLDLQKSGDYLSKATAHHWGPSEPRPSPDARNVLTALHKAWLERSDLRKASGQDLISFPNGTRHVGVLLQPLDKTQGIGKEPERANTDDGGDIDGRYFGGFGFVADGTVIASQSRNDSQTNSQFPSEASGEAIATGLGKMLPERSPADTETSNEKPKNFIPSHVLVLKGNPVTYQCTLCKAKPFSTRHHCMYHRFCDGRPKPFKCPVCSAEFISKSHLQYHGRTHSGERPFECQICSKRFTQRGKLTLHTRTHTAEGLYVCETCPKAFCTMQGLRRHNLVHTGEKPYQCPSCPSKFRWQSGLTKHMISHSGTRNHLCHACPATFSAKWSLDEHLKRHAPNRPFECIRCPRTFSTRKDLIRHANVHTGVQPFPCPTCGRRFGRKDHLDRHVRTMHV